MQTFNRLTGIIAPLLESNIDTDVIMPKQFLKGIDRQGLDKGVFYDRRFLTDGRMNPCFILNQPEYQPATFLVVGKNFGCGSSREHAVWGLQQLGIRALFGTTFAGIFDDNCLRNGILTVSLDPTTLDKLTHIANNPNKNQITVSLESCEIQTCEDSLLFEISQVKKNMLMSGEDLINWTLTDLSSIEQFEHQHYMANPWLKRV
ncbi:3-isopropylmalate dehydratase small subunit [Moraxella osloensis]|jgi:3-isopropylmalate/(R)-2-methylmalate dehydratase small subunit|nr:3-isopropylmalate dehydratase small subunit [Moraxella osloensis]ATQ86305.1 3-isopropylmalate dehydratase small subunit [Moraxella osloensis]PAL12915.1 3-isopropylmalate dehydratase small subunit [Moraxella osloensis]